MCVWEGAGMIYGWAFSIIDVKVFWLKRIGEKYVLDVCAHDCYEVYNNWENVAILADK